MARFLDNITDVFRKNQTLEVLTYPDPRLHRVCPEVDFTHDLEVAELSQRLIKALESHDGVGLAAPQAGILKRMFVYSSGSSDEEETPCVLVNPVITWRSDEEETAEEGCLSFPNIYFPVTRPACVSVKGFDEQGNPVCLENVEGFLARVIQHEFDHLDGVMILDRATPSIRKKALRAYATYDQQSEPYITITDDKR